MRFPILFLCLLTAYLAPAQNEEHANYDTVYVDYINSTKFHVEGLFNTVPLINLNSGGRLELTFDDLDTETRNYVYRIVHCDRDWNESSLAMNEYLDGFIYGQIETFALSFNTKTSYVNYQLFLPNREVQFTKSGNYLLHVYEGSTEELPVLTRRFMVVEPLMTVEARLVGAANVSKFDTHQEIDFRVNHPNVDIRSPRTEVTATVLQNGRWDNALRNLQPFLIKPEQLVFDYQDKVVFPAGREYRFADIRSLRTYSGNVVDIRNNKDNWDVTLRKDNKRNNSSGLTQNDLNGGFIIESLDNNRDMVESDYADVLFVFDTQREFWDQEVYLFGGFTDWQIQPWHRMVWNERINAYVGRSFLKQGFYNYSYVTVDQESREISTEMTEGDWYETENLYTILVYWRPFGARYDQLVGAQALEANR